MANHILDSKINNIRLSTFRNSLNNLSKFSSVQVKVKGFSKFSKEIKSELDIQIPMEVEFRILKEGNTKDGMIDKLELESSVDLWESLPIIDFHDMDDMNNPTAHKITDRKGYTGKNPRLEVLDGTEWIINDAFITDRYLAYLIYLHEEQERPLEISAEFQRGKMFKGTKMHLVNIKPHVISIVDQGEIKGNKITIKNKAIA